MYINFVTEENRNIYITFWLLLITFLVGLMILVGGLTRLTDSGLSITRWDLISGILPPLNTRDWETYFALYKNIPEYKLLNSKMTLEEFKIIYWWEYTHRSLGRMIGIFYFLPLVYFTWKKYFENKFLKSFYFIFILILAQGIIGWYMVRSGLTENTDVSHYRLSLHLTLAFIIFIFLLWHCLIYINKENVFSGNKIPYFLPILFLICIVIQISIGALVAGLDAGQIYNTWPLMNGKYFPDDSSFRDLFSLNSFAIPSLVQFMHRNIAYFIFFLFFLIATIIFKNNDFVHLRKTTLLIFISLIFQIFLGICTVLSGAQIIIASMHQIGSILLITTSLILVFKNSRIN